jgi:16S rRNA processing protein RimM
LSTFDQRSTATSIKGAAARSDRLVAIGQIARPHGVQGELRVRVYNPESGLLGRGRTVHIQPAEGPARLSKVARVRETEGALLVTLDGVDDRTAAEAVRGAELLIKRSEFPDLPEGEFYACDVEGARALLNGELVGTVVRLQSYPTCDVLVITKPGGEEVELPLVDGLVDRVDGEAGEVHITSLDTL